MKLKGIYPAIASPCNENDIFLEDQFAQLIKHLYQSRINGLYICGGTGDGYNMTTAERKLATEIAVEMSKPYGGITITQVGAGNMREAISLARHAAQHGADAVSSMPPINKTVMELKAYYHEIATAAGIPTIIYYIPLATNYKLNLNDILTLLDVDGVTGIKITDWNLYFIKQILLRRPDLYVLSGMDEILLPALMYGAHGGIGLWYNLFPNLFAGIFESVQKGNLPEAMVLQEQLLKISCLAGNHGIKKVFEHLMHQCYSIPFCFRKPRLDKEEKIPDDFSSLLNDSIKTLNDEIKRLKY